MERVGWERGATLTVRLTQRRAGRTLSFGPPLTVPDTSPLRSRPRATQASREPERRHRTPPPHPPSVTAVQTAVHASHHEPHGRETVMTASAEMTDGDTPTPLANPTPRA
jgi:hypothetical protein